MHARTQRRDNFATRTRARARWLLAAGTLCAGALGSVAADAAAPPAYAAKATITPSLYYVGDSAGSVYSFTVKNTGTTTGIGAVEIRRPSTRWQITSCPTAPAGWTKSASSSMCRYRSASTKSDDLKPGQSATFSVKAKTGASTVNRTGTWSVVVSSTNHFDTPSALKAASGRRVTVLYTFEVSSATVATGAATAGGACPPLVTDAVRDSSVTIVVCGRNHASAALTPVSAYSTLGGTFVATRGTFVSGSIPANSAEVVLGSWVGTEVPDVYGTDKKVIAGIGAASNRTSPLRTFRGYDVVSRLPLPLDDAHTTAEDTPVTVTAPGVLANDSDPDGDVLTAGDASDPAHGAVTLNADGSFTYTPDADFHGTDSFTYTAHDGFAPSVPATVTITVTPVADAPVGTDDPATTSEDAATSIGVLANDLDVDGDTLAVTAVDVTGVQGVVTNHGTHVSYDPNGEFEGLGAGQEATETFTYTVSDGALTDTATVTVTVTGVNDAPVTVADTATTDEDSDTVVSPLTNDTDAEGAVTVTSIDDTGTTGTVTDNGDGTVTYDPNGAFESLGAGEDDTDTFTYTVTDLGGATSTGTVTVTVTGVNDAPVGAPDATTLGEDASDTTLPVLDNDTDVEGDTLSVDSVDVTGTEGVVTNHGTHVSYDPNGAFDDLSDGDVATDTFTYDVSDGALTATVVVTITIDGGNDAPVAVDDTSTTDEATGKSVDVVANDTDAEGPVTVTSVDTTGTAGTVTNNNDGTVTYDPNGAFESLGAGEDDTDTFTYTVTDSDGATDTATVTVTVTGINDAPVAADDSRTVSEDDGDTSVFVLGNDTDAESDALAVSAVDVTGVQGVVTNHGTHVSYDPDGAFEGLTTGETANDTFTYTVSDGATTDTATVTITVTGINDAPVAVDDTATTPEDTPVTVSVLANDTDDEGAVTLTGVSDAVNGVATANGDGTVTFAPGANFAGTASFDYTATDSDGVSDTATATITVTPVNDGPVAAPDSATVGEDSEGANIDVLANDTDVEDDGLTVSSVDLTGTVGVVTNNGTNVTYDPNGMYEFLAAGETATDSFTYTVSDGALTDIETVTVTIQGANDAPVANDDAYDTLQDEALDVPAPGVLTNDTDADNGAVRTAGNATDPANGTVTLNPDGSFVYTPDAGFSGTDTFDYDVSDGTVSDTATVTITVILPNATPVAADTSASGNEDGGAITVTLTGTDADGDALTFTVGTATNGLVTVPSGTTCDANTPSTCTATVTYTPNANSVGTDEFTYVVNDGTLDSANGTATITVNPVNDAPSFTEGADQALLEDAGPQTVAAWATGISSGPSDEAAQTVTFTVTTDNDGLFSALPAVAPDGTLTYTPAANGNGAATVSVTAVDDGGTANGGVDSSPTRTFTISVTAVNDAPSFTKGADQSLNEDAGAQSVSNWASAISKGPGDESAQSLSFTTSNDNNALFSVQPGVTPTGTLVYTAAPNKYGTATVTIYLSDNGGTANGGDDTSDAQTFTITVNAVNDAPVAAPKSYSVQTNMKISLGGLLTGATDTADTAQEPGYTPTFTLGGISAGAGCIGCTISNINTSAGTFEFEPPAGQTGTFTVNYTVVDSGFPGPGATSASQTITFTVSGPVIWFVDGTSGNDLNSGTLTRPFATLGKAATVDAVNHRIFVHQGSYGDAITLNNGEWLIGSGAEAAGFDALMGINPPAGTAARPAINGTRPTIQGAVTLGSGNTIRGLTLSGGPALTGTSFGTLTTGSGANADVAIATSGQALMLTTGTIDGDLVSTSSSGGTNNVLLNSVATTGVTDLGTGALSGAAAEGLRIIGGTGSFDYAGTVGNAAGTTVAIANRTGGIVNLTGAVSDTAGAGVALTNNSGSTTNLTGGVTLSSGTSPAFLATGGGTVSVTGAANTLSSTTGTALTVTDTSIGSSDLTFRSISSNGATRGIYLSNTGSSGNLVVTGNGGTCTLADTSGCSGGVIASSTGGDDGGATPGGTGIVLNNTRDVSLTRMRIHDASNYAVRGTNVTNLTIASSVVNGTNGTNAATPYNDGGLRFDNLTGTGSFTGLEVTGGHSDNIAIDNTSGTLNATFSALRVGANSTSNGNDGLQVEGLNAATVHLTVQNSTFTSSRGDLFQYINDGSGGGSLTFTGNTLTNNHPGIATGGGGVSLFAGANGPVTMNVTGNSVRDAVGNAWTVVKTPGSGSVTGTFSNNTVGVAGIANSGSLEGSGAVFEHAGTGTMTWTITNNQIHQYNNFGLNIQAGSGVVASGNVNTTISGNTIANPGNNPVIGNPFQGIHVNSGVTPGDTFTTCVHFGANSVTGAGRNGGHDVRVRHRQNTTVRLPGYTGGQYDAAAAAAFVLGKLGGSPVVSAATSSTGGGFTGTGTAC